MVIRFLIMNAYSFGGTVRTVLNTAAALADRHEVEVVSMYQRREQPSIPHDPRIRVRPLVVETKARERSLDQRRDPAGRVIRVARSTLQARRSRLIHHKDFRFTNFSLLTDAALLRFLRSVDDGVLVGTRAGLNLAIARYAKPSVVRIGQEHLHLGRYREEMREAYQRYLPRLDTFVSLTERDAAHYREFLPEGPRIEAIPNAVPDTGEGVSPLTEKVVIAAGRLARQKGFDLLIPAWKIVADRHPDWKLRVFGNGDMRDGLQHQIDESGVGSSMQLMGFTSRLHDEMRQASVFVMSSRFEGFPMTLLEAMSCGLAVVSFDCDNGPADIISHGEDGLVVPDGDVEALAAGMCDLIEDAGKRRRLGVRAAETVTQYEQGAIVRRWEDLFEELATQKAAVR